MGFILPLHLNPLSCRLSGLFPALDPAHHPQPTLGVRRTSGFTSSHDNVLEIPAPTFPLPHLGCPSSTCQSISLLHRAALVWISVKIPSLTSSGQEVTQGVGALVYLELGRNPPEIPTFPGVFGSQGCRASIPTCRTFLVLYF